jgi:hypothetical protein
LAAGGLGVKITIGETREGKKVDFDLDTLIVTRLLIQANSGAGKSYLLRKLMEELFGHIQVIAIDPEGEFATLREKYGFVLVGKGGETPADIRTAADVAEKLLELKASAICDLYEMKSADRHVWVKIFLDAMIDAPKKLWHPLIVIVDEAQLFCPQGGKGGSESVAKESMIDLTTRGRKRGYGAVWATQRLAKVDKDATSSLLNRLIGGTFEDVDVKRALDMLSIPPEHKREISEQLRTLDPGWFYAFGRAVSKTRVLFKTGKVETSHPQPGSAKHAAEPPPPPEKVQALLPKLADLPKIAEEKAQTLADLKKRIRELSGELSQAKKSVGVHHVHALHTVDARLVDRALQNAVRDAVGQTLEVRDQDWMRAVRDYQVGLNKRIVDFASSVAVAVERYPFRQPKHISKLSVDVLKKLPSTEIVPIGTTDVPSRARAHDALSGQTSPVAARERTTPEPSAGEAPDNTNGEGDISRPQMRILEALALFESIDRLPVSKKWTAALSEASHASSSYGNNLGALRSRGLIDYPAPGMIALTEAGRALAPAVDAPTSSDEILERCKKIVSAPQWEILQALVKSYPHARGKVVLAEELGVSPSSSSYANNLGALRSAGMIDYPAQGAAKAADWLFLE